VKRLHFIFNTVVVAVYGLLERTRPIAVTGPAMQLTWAEHFKTLTGGRRYEHYIQVKVCHGEYDRSMSAEQAAERRARCAKICGLCRHIHLLEVWPDPNYRRPTQVVLAALADEPFYSPRLLSDQH
jgi:hypothetical protein